MYKRTRRRKKNAEYTMDGKSSERDREGKYYLIQNGIYNIIWGMLLLAFNNIFK